MSSISSVISNGLILPRMNSVLSNTRINVIIFFISLNAPEYKGLACGAAHPRGGLWVILQGELLDAGQNLLFSTAFTLYNFYQNEFP